MGDTTATRMWPPYLGFRSAWNRASTRPDPTKEPPAMSTRSRLIAIRVVREPQSPARPTIGGHTSPHASELDRLTVIVVAPGCRVLQSPIQLSPRWTSCVRSVR